MIKPNQPVRTNSDWPDAYPNSTRVYVDGPNGIRVPVREIALSGGEPPLRVYDTSGPLACDVQHGLPALRHDWIMQRDDVVTHHASRITNHGSTPETLRRSALRAKPGCRTT